MERLEVKKIIEQIEKKRISVIDVPDEYQNDIDIVEFEHKSGLRITENRGFDIISNAFFVEEYLVYVDVMGEERKKPIFLSFENFDSYYDFLKGDIYNNACYTFCNRLDSITASYKINLGKFLARKSFVKDTVDDYSFEPTEGDKKAYEKGKQVHKQCRQWMKKFRDCQSYDDLVKTSKNYCKSKLSDDFDLNFFLFQYLFADTEDKQRISVITKYISSAAYPQYDLLNGLCSIYDPDEVIQSLGSLEVNQTLKQRLIKYILLSKEGKIEFVSKAFFDKKTHYYCEKTKGYQKNNKCVSIATIYRCFESFDEFINYRNGDLTHCDLSDAFECDADFSVYNIDKTTKLPLYANKEINYSIKKFYRNRKFYVIQQWHNSLGCEIKQYVHFFDYFFDFVAFLKGDLSEAELIFCDGLIFLEDWNGIDFANAKMRSCLCEKFGLQYEAQGINTDLVKSFSCIEENEKATALAPQSQRDLVEISKGKGLLSFDMTHEYKCQIVHYISDLHLMHRIQNAHCHSKEDIIYVVVRAADTIAHEAGNLLLINGDVSSDFGVFQLFVEVLSQALHRKPRYRNTKVVFTLGNHELWNFPDDQIEQIASRYRTFLNEYGMYLLNNDLLYQEDQGSLAESRSEIHLIKYNDLCQMEEMQISERLRNARYVILGGLGFSGYNTEFNANNGIYRMTVDRTTEVKESKIFEELYNRLRPILDNKNTIILTHTPKKDWCREEGPDKNYVYVSGHTHRNFYYDDGEYRIYSDNQVGYHNKAVHLKTFLIDSDYDCFYDYSDGIFKITREQYIDFYRGKNISMTFNKGINVLYMLKKNGYYCFIHESRNGIFTILNGGTMKRLKIRDIQYYYDNMDTMISKIKSPLDKFTTFQKNIADTVKRIGGTGTIHGCIIDIDFFNHIYVNPIDLTVTGYHALNVVNKTIYPSIPALLEKNCPKMFIRYFKLFKDNSENPLVPIQNTNIEVLPCVYLDTDIYKASREIKKMQKLNSNILSTWYEDSLHSEPKIERI